MEEFLDQLERIPWFSRLGNPLSGDCVHKQIHSWEEWPGPEEESVSAVHLRQQALHDNILAESKQLRPSLEELWKRIDAVVIRVAAPSVPFDANEDAWYAPNVAVWHAAWTAGLVGLYEMSKKPMPANLHAQWNCFTAGHWPFGWKGEFPKGKPIIY
jgi:hypothetical protein